MTEGGFSTFVNVHFKGRRVGQVGDIGGVVAFLCSDAANWVNGRCIKLAGGIHL
jgi:NAD(P)-dependent dehydrogenase (short-subunit alcohol dehydrogenase family)